MTRPEKSQGRTSATAALRSRDGHRNLLLWTSDALAVRLDERGAREVWKRA